MEQPYKNAPKHLVEYYCSTPFVAILSLCTRRIILFIIVAALCYISKYLWDIYYNLHKANLSRFRE